MQSDWWENFSLGLDKGYDEQGVSLVGHAPLPRDRPVRPGALGQREAESGHDQNRQRAYALGYLTHLATDVTGHAFVNAISGGPFRTHWQRHHLVENHIDYLLVPLRRRRAGAADDGRLRAVDGVSALLRHRLRRGRTTTGRSCGRRSRRDARSARTGSDKRLLDKDSKLPDDIADLLLQTITDVFYRALVQPAPAHPPHERRHRHEGLPTAELIQEAYDVFWQYLKFSTTDGLAHEPPLPPELFPNLDFPTITDPGDPLDDERRRLLGRPARLHPRRRLGAPLHRRGRRLARHNHPGDRRRRRNVSGRITLYYTVELPLFHLLKSFRRVLVMTGYVHPMADEIAQSLIRVGNPTR